MNNPTDVSVLAEAIRRFKFSVTLRSGTYTSRLFDQEPDEGMLKYVICGLSPRGETYRLDLHATGATVRLIFQEDGDQLTYRAELDPRTPIRLGRNERLDVSWLDSLHKSACVIAEALCQHTTPRGLQGEIKGNRQQVDQSAPRQSVGRGFL